MNNEMESSDCVSQVVVNRNSADNHLVNEPRGVRVDHDEESNAVQRDSTSSERKPDVNTGMVKAEPSDVCLDWVDCPTTYCQQTVPSQDFISTSDMTCLSPTQMQSDSNKPGKFAAM